MQPLIATRDDATLPATAARASLPVRTRRDPAPSRLRYRLQRLWLTPWVRWFLRLWLPLGIVGGIAFAVSTHPVVRAEITDRLSGLRAQLAARPEFQLTKVTVVGVSDALAAKIEARVGLSLPASSLDTDIAALKARAASVDGVAHVRARFAPGGIVEILAEERVPAVIWRLDGALTLLDRIGKPVAGLAARLDRPDMPVVAGPGADKQVPQALAILDVAQPVAHRVRGLVRVGGRRWDLVLDRGQTVRLPEVAPEAALRRVMALHGLQKLLDRDVLVVDLRDGRRPTIRLSHAALETLRARRSEDSNGGG